MASIQKRHGKYCVVYRYKGDDGKQKQKWETFDTMSEAKKRRKEIEYKIMGGTFVVPKCVYVKDLLKEYVELYGKDKWALSTYNGNTGLIHNYIEPMIGETKLSDVTTHFLEKFYQKLTTTPAIVHPIIGKPSSEFVGMSTIRDIHKLLRSCFGQAVKWELMEKNPADKAIVPKYKESKREIWTAETLMDAMEDCDDDMLKLAVNLAFSASLRIGELLALTWDVMDISAEAIESDNAYLIVDKELQRVTKESIKELDGKDIILVFPEESKLCKTVRVLKTPKTESSVRKVFLPKSVAEMLVDWKRDQDAVKEVVGDDYHDYNLVMATSTGMPTGGSSLRKKFNKLIDEKGLPDVVFHSLRHTSVTYKLKLNGGDVKAVQGDSGHAQVDMVTNVYSHIIDEDRKKNAQLFEEAFYGKKDLDPQLHTKEEAQKVFVPEGLDPDVLAKILANPEAVALLASLAKSIGGQ